MFYDLLHRGPVLAATKRRRFRVHNPVRTRASTRIERWAQVFDWARVQRTKGAIKLPLPLDDQGCGPCWALVTDGDTHDVRRAPTLRFAPGTIVVIDRGYVDYARSQRWTTAGIWLVTRPRTTRIYPVGDRRPVSTRGPVLTDEVIQ